MRNSGPSRGRRAYGRRSAAISPTRNSAPPGANAYRT